jgi:hypothetical protein
MFVEGKMQMERVRVDQLVMKPPLEAMSGFIHQMVDLMLFDLPEFVVD